MSVRAARTVMESQPQRTLLDSLQAFLCLGHLFALDAYQFIVVGLGWVIRVHILLLFLNYLDTLLGGLHLCNIDSLGWRCACDWLLHRILHILEP